MWTAGTIDMAGLDCFGPYQFDTFPLIQFGSKDHKEAVGTFHAAGNVPLSMMALRMRYNGHRHPVLFLADMEPDMVEYFQTHRSIEDCVLLIRASKTFAISSSSKHDWPILQRLVREFEPFNFDAKPELIPVKL